MKPFAKEDAASSNLIATILMVSITIAIAALFFVALFLFPVFPDNSVPDTIPIKSVKHTDDNGVMINNGWVVLVNSGSVDYNNYMLYARTYVNGNEKEIIPSMNANEFIPSHHFDVQNIGGLGSDGSPHNTLSKWYKNQELYINYKNGLIHPGDTLVIEIYNKSSGRIISRDTWPHTDPRTKTDWWISEFTHPAV